MTTAPIIRAVFALIFAAVFSGGVVSSAHADQRDDLKQTETERAKAEARAKALRDQEAKARAEIAKLRPRLIATANAIQTQEDKLTAIEGRLARLDGRRKLIVRELADGDATLTATLLALSRLSRRPATAALVQPGNLTQKARGAGLMARIVPRIAADTETLTKRLNELRQVASETTRERDAAIIAREALDRHQQDLNSLLAQKQKRQEELSAARQAEDLEVARLVRKASSLKDLIARLDRQAQLAAERAKVTPSFKPASQTEDPKAPSTKNTEGDANPAIKGTATNDATGPSTGTKALQGRLALPVRGSIAWRYGQNNRAGQRLRGIEIAARPGAWVTTPLDGRVSYAGPFRSYGQILIVATNDGYHMVLARLGETSSRVGDILLTGEPVGALPPATAPATANAKNAGRSASQTSPSPHLYVEMRHNGRPVDPLPWFAPSQRKLGN